MPSRTRRRQRFNWQYVPMAGLAFASTWASAGRVAALIAAGVGLVAAIAATVWANQRGVERIHVRARYSVLGTLAVIGIGTALTVALK